MIPISSNRCEPNGRVYSIWGFRFDTLLCQAGIDLRPASVMQRGP
jgi:hypothetical protein